MQDIKLRNTLLVIGLTIGYLILELGFNARLLDIVGGAATTREVHDIEVFGRTLSGIAAALVVFQLMLGRRAAGSGPAWWKILAAVLATVVVVYFSIKGLVEYLVTTSTPQFRQMATNTTLVQRGLVEGKIRLAGIDDDPTLFAAPEGKAFLAVFPLLALSVQQLEEKTRDVKLELIEDAVSRQLGGNAGYFNAYKKAMEDVRKQYASYSRVAAPSEDDLESRQDKAWNDYLESLSRRGWTPETVPPGAQQSVVRAVQKKGVPVPANWHPADEYTFRASVKSRYEASMRKASRGAPSIPPGLSFPAFVAHPTVQGKLRTALEVPAGTRIASQYGTAEDFSKGLFKPVIKAIARNELKKYDAPPEKYAQGGPLMEMGLDAARAVIVPPIALFFSLLGAIGHFGKLIFLSLKAGAAVAGRMRLPRAEKLLGHAGFPMLAIVVCSIWLALSNIDNRVTSSELYKTMIGWATTTAAQDDAAQQWKNRIFGNVIHVVSVGQGYGYPMNEWIRTQILQGFDYGYAQPNR